MSVFEIDSVIIGAGVVGLSVAYQLRSRGDEILILEAEDGVGRVNSSRNSGVIHAGIYYPAGSLKSKLCVRGKELLYRYCDNFNVAHRKIGKLIVACSVDQETELEKIQLMAATNGVDDLSILTAAEVESLEPDLNVRGALLSPSTGIIDPIEYMNSLQGCAEDAGVQISYNCVVKEVDYFHDGRLLLIVDNDGSEVRLVCRCLINASGLMSTEVRDKLPIEGKEAFSLRYAKGNYFSYAQNVPFDKLIYPVPERHGLGIHLTLDLAGQITFGPDVEWVDTPSFDVDPSRKKYFQEKISAYFPSVNAQKLHPAYSGIRPKLIDNEDNLCSDFVVEHLQGESWEAINLMGIESPGLTSSLAIAEHVEAILCA